MILRSNSASESGCIEDASALTTRIRLAVGLMSCSSNNCMYWAKVRKKLQISQKTFKKPKILSLSPVTAVQTAIANGFSDMMALDIL